MAFIKGLAAGAAGAAAYNIYHDVDISTGKDLASGLFDAFQRKGAAQVAEVRLAGRRCQGPWWPECLRGAGLKRFARRQRR
jgi:hypothetical protein